MLRLTPTRISLAMSDIKIADTRMRYRKYLKAEERARGTVHQMATTATDFGATVPTSPILITGKAEQKTPQSSTRTWQHLVCSPRCLLNGLDEDDSLIPEQVTHFDTHLEDESGPSSSLASDIKYLAMRPRRGPRVQSIGESHPDDNDGSSVDAPKTLMWPIPSTDETMTLDKAVARPGQTKLLQQGSWRGHLGQNETDGRVISPSLEPVAPEKVAAEHPSKTGSNTGSARRLQGERNVSPAGTPTQRSSMRSSRYHRALVVSPRGPSNVVRAAVEIIGSRIRSPDSRTTPRAGTLASPGHEPVAVPAEPSMLAAQPTTPRLRVYNDSLPAMSQPQTPEHLPEARHRSQLPGSYTAPITRSRARAIGATPVTARRPRNRRDASPAGLDTPGFKGLYGGRENSDDPALFEQAEAMRNPGRSGLPGTGQEMRGPSGP